MTLKKKKLLWTISALTILALVIVVGRSYVLYQIKAKLEQQLASYEQLGIKVTYDTLTIDWRSNTLYIKNIALHKNVYDTTCLYPEVISATHVRAKGFRLMSLLFKRQVSFEVIDIVSPYISLHQRSEFVADTLSRKTSQEFVLLADRINMPLLHVEYADSTACKPIVKYASNAVINSFIIKFYPDRRPVFNLNGFHLDSITIDLPLEYYTLKIAGTTLNKKLRIFDLDTLQIIPHYGKIQFGKKKGFETDRIEGVIPYVNLTGISLRHQDTIAFSAKKAAIKMFLKVFRDKRLPFKDKTTVLPIQQLKNLPWGFNIETLTVNKSYIQYEEFVDGADSSGSVFFDNLYATIRNVNNMSHSDNGKTELVATASFMGQGDVQIKATCPWKASNSYFIKGSMKNFNIPRVNSILEPAVQIRAESGRLNYFTFQFWYNHQQSKGKLELNYNDLKLITFKEASSKKKKDRDNGDPVKKDGLKTFLLNTFIIRKNMDERVPEEKRTGTISFQRDTSRSVFNYWWKSVFSGIKSAYNLERLDDKKMKKLINQRSN